MEFDGKRWVSVPEPVVGEAVRLGHHRPIHRRGEGEGRPRAAQADLQPVLRQPDLRDRANRQGLSVGQGRGVRRTPRPAQRQQRRGRPPRRHPRRRTIRRCCSPSCARPTTSPAPRTPTGRRRCAALPDIEVADWLQVRFGQSITGYPTPDDVMTFLNGGGENGKTTMVDAIRESLGYDYAVTLPDRVLLANTGDHPTELMTLRGARLAFMEELPEPASEYQAAQGHSRQRPDVRAVLRQGHRGMVADALDLRHDEPPAAHRRARARRLAATGDGGVPVQLPQATRGRSRGRRTAAATPACAGGYAARAARSSAKRCWPG